MTDPHLIGTLNSDPNVIKPVGRMTRGRGGSVRRGRAGGQCVIGYQFTEDPLYASFILPGFMVSVPPSNPPSTFSVPPQYL